MAFAPIGVSGISLFKAVALDFNGSNWVSTGCSLAPSLADATRSVALKSGALRIYTVCSAIQESSTPTVSADAKEKTSDTKLETKSEVKPEAKPEAKPETKPEAKAETKPEAKTETKTEAKAAPAAKPKPPAKALPEMMAEDVIPSLRSILEAQKDITELELVFEDKRLEGSFLQNSKPYTFWAFFPDGTLTGPKGFSISSYGSEVSTVEPFLVDEKKPTAKQVVFWVEKRLAAQGIIPVWTK